MSSAQLEAGGGGVIELGFLPLALAVAASAVFAALALVDVVEGVAGDAFRSGALENLIGVARVAGERDMGASKLQAGIGAVVEARFFPGDGRVAAAAIRPEVATVRIIPLVAARADRVGFPECRAVGMAVGAAGRGMSPEQFESGTTVIERFHDEARDVRIPSLVFGVAVAAVAIPGCFEAVQSAAERDVLGDLLVTALAQQGFPLAAEGLMAGRALRLGVRMTGDDRSRHDQRFQSCRLQVQREQNQSDSNRPARFHGQYMCTAST